MSVGLYMDHHVPGAITAGLRRRGVDCLTAAEDGMARVPDDRLLARATELDRVLYTNDVDLLVITANWLATGRAFAGVIFAEQQRITVGRAVADLELLAKVYDPAEWTNRVEYLPL